MVNARYLTLNPTIIKLHKICNFLILIKLKKLKYLITQQTLIQTTHLKVEKILI